MDEERARDEVRKYIYTAIVISVLLIIWSIVDYIRSPMNDIVRVSTYGYVIETVTGKTEIERERTIYGIITDDNKNYEIDKETYNNLKTGDEVTIAVGYDEDGKELIRTFKSIQQKE